MRRFMWAAYTVQITATVCTNTAKAFACTMLPDLTRRKSVKVRWLQGKTDPRRSETEVPDEWPGYAIAGAVSQHFMHEASYFSSLVPLRNAERAIIHG